MAKTGSGKTIPADVPHAGDASNDPPRAASQGAARYRPLEKALGYHFTKTALLEQALSHRSLGGNNNERLEFLGDGILGGLVADLLYGAFPGLPEGPLTRHRATLVRKETLAELARELAIGEHVRLGPGELKSGGYKRDSILANAYEAVIGAIYIDGGYDAARLFIDAQFSPRIAALDTVADTRDPKTRLQEYLQKRGMSLPRYEMIDSHGADHDRTFVVACFLDDVGSSYQAEGKSRKVAEQRSADTALRAIHDDRDGGKARGAVRDDPSG